MSDNKPSMRAIADRAGTSTGTVSRVLNGGPVAAATRERVLSAIQATGYRPKYLANRSRRLAVCLPAGLGGMSGPYPSGILAGVAAEAADRQRQLLVFAGTDLAEAFTGLRTEAVLVIGDGADAAILEQAALGRRILRLHSWHERLSDVLQASADSAACGRLAVQALCEAGHRRLASIRSVGGGAGGEQFRSAAATTAAAAGASLLDLPVSGPDAVAHAMLQLLDQDERPTGLILERPHYILPALQAAWRHGLRLPQDCSVVARECTEARWGLPPLTTVGFDHEALGRAALAMLDDSLDRSVSGGREPYREPAFLIRRASIAVPSTTP